MKKVGKNIKDAKRMAGLARADCERGARFGFFIVNAATGPSQKRAGNPQECERL